MKYKQPHPEFELRLFMLLPRIITISLKSHKIQVNHPLPRKILWWEIYLILHPNERCNNVMEHVGVPFVYIYIYIYIYIRGSLNNFIDFFVWALLLIVHTWNPSPLRSNFLWLQCTCCNVPTTSRSSHRSLLVSVSMAFVKAFFILSIVS